MAMITISRILGETHPWPTVYDFTNPDLAYHYALEIKSRCPEGEAAIAKDPFFAYYYAKDIIKGRWPECEAAILTDPYRAFRYMRDVVKGRWPEAEALIASSTYKTHYLDLFPEAADDWLLNGWIDWMDT